MFLQFHPVSSFSISGANLVKSSVRSASLRSWSISTLKARSAALPSPLLKMSRSSEFTKLPLMPKAFRISASACFLAEETFSPLPTKYRARSYSKCVSRLMFTVLRSVRSVRAFKVTVPLDFLPVISLRKYPYASRSAYWLASVTLETLNLPPSVVILPVKLLPV